MIFSVIADQITQVFMNLLNNAADACEGGGVITVETAALAQQVVIRVHDSGVGIRPEDQEHIFEPFFTTKPQAKGERTRAPRQPGNRQGARWENCRGEYSGSGSNFFSHFTDSRENRNEEQENPVG